MIFRFLRLLGFRGLERLEDSASGNKIQKIYIYIYIHIHNLFIHSFLLVLFDFLWGGGVLLGS